MVKDFMEFTESFDSEPSIGSRNDSKSDITSNESSINDDSEIDYSINTSSNSSTINTPRDTTSKTSVDSLANEDYSSSDKFENAAVNDSRKTNNISLPNKNPISKTKSSVKGKKYKKNKAKHPQNSKKI
jgi:hypothetical protein